MLEHRRHALTVAAALSFAGCATAPEGDTEGWLAAETPSDPTASLDGGTPVDAAHPGERPAPIRTFATQDGAFTASFWHDGTGCPRGALGPALAPDGSRVHALMSVFESRAEALQSAHRDCWIDIELRSGEPLAFTIEAVDFSGYAYLQEGVSARARLAYHFVGDRDGGSDIINVLQGPYDDAFVLAEPVPPPRKVSSPCGRVHTLRAALDLLVRSSAPERRGYASIESNAISTPPEFRLRWQKCDG